MSNPQSDPTQRLCAAAGLAPGTGVDPARAAELAATLLEFAGSLDQTVWNTWKLIAPGSAVKRGPGVKAAAGAALNGDAGGAAQVRVELDRLRALTAALSAAINQAGRQFAKDQVERVAPSEIEALARMSSGGLLTAHETKCWRKYVELTAGRDASTVQGELMKAVAAYTESLLAQAGQGGPGGPGGQQAGGPGR